MPSPSKTINQSIDSKDCIQIQEIIDKLNSLMPLAPLIEPLEQIVKREYEQEVVSKRMVKIGKAIGFIASIVTGIGIIFGAAWIMIEAIIRIKE